MCNFYTPKLTNEKITQVFISWEEILLKIIVHSKIVYVHL